MILEKDLVSIIIPVYNAGRFLNDTINTILSQTYQNFEAIFVDDGSTDNSVEVIKECKDTRVKLLYNDKNEGVALTRNKGIENAQGRFICFLDADDLWEKEKLEKQIKFMKKQDCAFSFTGYEFADINGIPSGKKVFIPEKFTYKQALKNTTISTITVMFDTKKLDKKLIMQPKVKSEDTATWWKVLKNGYDAYGLNEILSYYRKVPGSLSSNKVEAVKKIWNLYRNVEKMKVIDSCYCFTCYAFNAVKRRI